MPRVFTLYTVLRRKIIFVMFCSCTNGRKTEKTAGFTRYFYLNVTACLELETSYERDFVFCSCKKESAKLAVSTRSAETHASQSCIEVANACKTSPCRSLSAPLAVDWADAGHCLEVAPMNDSCSSRADVEVFGVPVSLAGADLGKPLSPARERCWQSIDDGATVTREKQRDIYTVESTVQSTCTSVLARIQMHDVSESIALSECLTCNSGTCTCRNACMSLDHGESPKSKQRRLDRERQRRRRASESELERSNRLGCNDENQRRRRSRESGIQSHTTKARKVETVDDRQLRLKLQTLALHVANSRARESEEKRSARLEAVAGQVARRRARETGDERAVRLQTVSARSAAKRACETDEERAVRLQEMATRDSDRRARETDEERTLRLQAMYSHVSDRRARETDEERAVRLQTVSSHVSDRRRARETDDERAVRLQTVFARCAAKRARETDEERAATLRALAD